MKNFLSIVVVFAIVLSVAAPAHAETKIYRGVGEYFLTDETVDFAKNRAELSAERDALEQVCLFVKSHSAAKNFSLEDDEIIIVATGILRVIDTEFAVDNDAEGIKITAIVTAEIDNDELEKLLERAVNERGLK